MIKKIKNFLNKNFSFVKQENLKDKGTIEKNEKFIIQLDEIENEKPNQENDDRTKAMFSEHRNFSKCSNSSLKKFEKFAENLKMMKNRDEKKYTAILKKFSLIKSKTKNNS